MKKTMFIVAAACGVGLAAWFLIGGSKASTEPAAQTATVVRGDISAGIAATGKVVSNLDVDIKCRASGEVKTLPFDVSDAVKKADLLLQLDPMDQERDVRKAETAVAQSKAKLAQAQQNLLVAESDVTTGRKRADAAIECAQIKARTASARAERRQQLLKEKLGSAEDLETTLAEAATANSELETAQVQAEEIKTKELTVQVNKHAVELAQAQLAADQIALENAKQQLAYTRVEAPIDGVVSARNIQIGSIISSGITNVGGGTTVMTISDVSRLYVLASVDEADIGQVKLGQAATITADAFAREQFQGKVIRIATTGVNTSNVVTFEVKVEVTSANKQLLKPVMTANVQIIRDQRHQVLMAPELAVNRNGGKTTLTVPGSAQTPASEKPVVLGLSDGENVEIISGVDEGQQVVVRKEVASRWASQQKKTGMGPPPPG